MNEQQNIETVKRGYEAFNSGDIPALLDLFAEDITWRAPRIEGAPYTGSYDGREAVGEFFSTLDEAEEFSNFEPREFIAQDEKVVVLGSMTATVKDTNREYSRDWVHIFTTEKLPVFWNFSTTPPRRRLFKKPRQRKSNRLRLKN
jgi:uncharacterized protein